MTIQKKPNKIHFSTNKCIDYFLKQILDTVTHIVYNYEIVLFLKTKKTIQPFEFSFKK